MHVEHVEQALFCAPFVPPHCPDSYCVPTEQLEQVLSLQHVLNHKKPQEYDSQYFVFTLGHPVARLQSLRESCLPALTPGAAHISTYATTRYTPTLRSTSPPRRMQSASEQSRALTCRVCAHGRPPYRFETSELCYLRAAICVYKYTLCVFLSRRKRVSYGVARRCTALTLTLTLMSCFWRDGWLCFAAPTGPSASCFLVGVPTVV